MKRTVSGVFGLYSALGLVAGAALHKDIPHRIWDPDNTAIKARALDICLSTPKEYYKPLKAGCYLSTRFRLEDERKAVNKLSAFLLLLGSSLGMAMAAGFRLQEYRARRANPGPEAGL